jgi:hypothetical protein
MFIHATIRAAVCFAAPVKISLEWLPWCVRKRFSSCNPWVRHRTVGKPQGKATQFGHLGSVSVCGFHDNRFVCEGLLIVR